MYDIFAKLEPLFGLIESAFAFTIFGVALQIIGAVALVLGGQFGSDLLWRVGVLSFLAGLMLFLGSLFFLFAVSPF